VSGGRVPGGAGAWVHHNPAMASTLRGGLQPTWSVRGITFGVWLLAVGSAVYWVLQVAATPAGAPMAPPVLRSPPPPDVAAVARLLGGDPASSAPQAGAPPTLASRFVLQGIVASPSGGGAALIAVDGRPPRPFRVGTAVAEGLVLQSLQGRQAVLGEQRGGPPTLTLELPARPS